MGRINSLTIEEAALSELSSLKELELFENELVSVPDNVFEGLTDLTYLDLDDNPEFPLTALIQAKSVITLYLRYKGYHTLDPYVFQQMDSLKYLYLSDPFVCDCKLQWTSQVEQYGLYIRYPVCSDSSGQFSKSITNESLYTNCSQTESLNCFSKSSTCPSNQVCHNTGTGHCCGCPRGYVLPSSGQCRDEDECNEVTNCQHTCVNTDGSFHCTCNEGYELASDGYSCDDINECLDLNGGCEFGCLNTMGSYQCQCHHSLELINKTHCDTEIQCNVVQYIGNEYYHYSCNGEYNLTITNFTCEDIPKTNVANTSSTTTTPTPSSDCPIGYVQRYSGECVDEDECDYNNNCDYSCVNTDGSFYCDCDKGYKLEDNGYSCDDINECHESNGGCEFGCRNTIGSYQCYCYHGYELKNETHCDTEILCDVIQDDGSQEHHFTCREGFKLTINNLTCNEAMVQGIGNPSTAITCSSSEQIQASTIIMFIVLIFIIFAQTVIMILVLLCSFALRRTAKNPKVHRNMRGYSFRRHYRESPLYTY